MTPEPSRIFEELVARHAAGDRSPALLQALNRAAFDCFHAPWEPAPSTTGPDNPNLPTPVRGRLPVETEEESGLDIPEIRPPAPSLSDRLCRALRGLRLAYYRQGSRTILLEPGYDSVSDSVIRLYLCVSPDRALIQVRATSDLTSPAESESNIRRWCDAWNARPDVPAAAMATRHPGGRCRVEGHWQLLVAPDAGMADLQSMIRDATSDAATFFGFLQDHLAGTDV